MKKYTVMVVGATGLVGRTMLAVLEERNFPVSRLIAVGSARSTGKEISFMGENIKVCQLEEKLFAESDIALFSAGGGVSKQYAPMAAQNNCVAIDNSSAWRMDESVPLVVPEVNSQHLRPHHRIIANPNCSTIQMVLALAPLHRIYRIRRIVVATYQAVTGSGQAAVQQLNSEMNGEFNSNPVYPYQIFENCLPHVDQFQEGGYTREEYKMVNETRKILGDSSIGISVTCVRVPVKGGHSEAINVEFESEYQLEDVRELLANAPGIIVQDIPDENIYPMPVYAEGKDEVFVGRIRRDSSVKNGLNMWVVSDNLRKGAATNAVQIAEHLIHSDTFSNDGSN